MRILRRSPRIIALSLTVLCGVGPMRVDAQQASAGPMPRARVSTTKNSCSQLSSTPTQLVRTPEGMAVMKMTVELRALESAMARDQNMSADERRRFTEATRNVDSAWRSLQEPADVKRMANGQRVYITIDSSMASQREREARIRDLNSTVAHFSERAAYPRKAVITFVAAGWMGIASSDNYVQKVENGTLLRGYCEYPLVESVTPGSPAEKAGVMAGDTILAYNGQDLLEHDIDFTHMLVPGQPLRMKVRRSGKTRELTVIVGKRPNESPMVITQYAVPCAGNGCDMRSNSLFLFDSDSNFTFRIPPLRDTVTGYRLMPPPSGRGGGGGGFGTRRPMGESRGGGGAGGAGGVAMAGSVPPSGFIFSSGDVIAGARLMQIDAEMATTMGLDSAGLVIQYVIPGSPAFDAGLKRGEFVREVNGIAVRDMMVLRKVMAIGPVDHIRLVITSKGKPSRVVTVP